MVKVVLLQWHCHGLKLEVVELKDAKYRLVAMKNWSRTIDNVSAHISDMQQKVHSLMLFASRR